MNGERTIGNGATRRVELDIECDGAIGELQLTVFVFAEYARATDSEPETNNLAPSFASLHYISPSGTKTLLKLTDQDEILWESWSVQALSADGWKAGPQR